MAAGPQPPSLQLPRQIPNLTASRTGDQVKLHWTTPRENTDRLKLQKIVQLRICRRQQQTASWDTVATVTAAPGKAAQYTDVLPAQLTTGPLRPLRYSIFGINKHGRTAGPSNIVMVLAGPTPTQVQNLSLQVVERGVLLHWQAVPNLPSGTSVEIERTLVTHPQATPARASAKPATSAKTNTAGNLHLLSRADEPVEQTLRVNLSAAGGQTDEAEENDSGIALDFSPQFGQKYSYTVRRVIERPADNRTLSVSGTPSASVEIETRDTFPPSTPVGLAAVPVSASMNRGVPEVDLSWSANTEPDLAQYRVYRQDVTLHTPVQQIGLANHFESIVAPAFRDLHVQPDHTYAYTISAVDTTGNESPRSQLIAVKVPAS
ncbi:MAG: hypothetical protein ABI076_00505 [Acidobacteriaceae bacterium]